MKDKSTPKYGLILGTLLFFVFLSMFKPELNLPPKAKQNQADFKFENMTMSHFESGIKQWVLVASKAEVFNQKNKTLLHDVTGEIFQDDEPMIYIEAPKAFYNMENSKMELFDANATINVEERHVNLISTKLVWTPEEGWFHGYGPSTIYTGPFKLKGEYFSANIPFRNFTLKQNSVVDIALTE